MAAKTPPPPSRKDEILALLEAHGIAVEVHTNREPEYARDFRDGEFVLIGRNPHEGGRDVEIWLQDEFTLIFGGWHQHDEPDETQYEWSFLKRLTGFIDGTLYAATSYSGSTFFSGAVLEADCLPSTPDEALQRMTWCLSDEAREKLTSPGGRVELVNWDPTKNVVFKW